MNKAQEIFDKGTKWLIKSEAFFALVFMGLKKVREDNDKTMGTDGKSLFWSIKFVIEMGFYKTCFVLLHETLHVVLKHCIIAVKMRSQLKDFDMRLFNNAADHLVNFLIVKMGLKADYAGSSDIWLRGCSREFLASQARSKHYICPEDAVFEPRFAGFTLIEIYNVLKREEKAQQDQPKPEPGEGTPDDETQPGEGNPGGGSDNGEPDSNENGDCPWGNFEEATNEEGEAPTQAEIDTIEKEIEQVLKTAETVAKGRGQMPIWLEEALGKLNAPSQDYTEALEEMMSEISPSDFSFAKTNFHKMASPIIMPGMDRTGIGHVALLSDASGSVSEAEFLQFASDWVGVQEQVNPEKVTLIQFSSRAGEPEIVEQGDEIDLTRKMSGGTDFRAPFLKAEEEGIDDFDVVIIFTDGADETWPEEPDFPVIWVTTYPFYRGNPPFGEVLMMDFKA